MVVFPSGFILSEAAAGRPLVNPRIGWLSYALDLTADDVEVSSESEEGPRDAPNREDTFSFWEPTSLPATRTIDLGALHDIDYAGVLGVIGSVGCAVKIETSIGDLDTDDEQVWELFSDEKSPGNDSPLMFLDDPVVARWIRLTLTGGATMPKVMVFWPGEVLAMPRPIYGGHRPGTLNRITDLHGSMSEGGQFLGQGFKRHGISSGFSFRNLPAAFMRDEFDAFVEHARSRPYFAAWRPETFPNECVYGWTLTDIAPVNQGKRDFMTVDFPIVGIGHR